MATQWKETELSGSDGRNAFDGNFDQRTPAEIAAAKIAAMRILGGEVAPAPPIESPIESTIEKIKKVITTGALTAALTVGGVVGGILISRGSNSQENPKISSPAPSYLSPEEVTILSPYEEVILSDAKENAPPQPKAIPIGERVERTESPITQQPPKSTPVKTETPATSSQTAESSPETQSIIQTEITELAFQELTAQELIESLFTEDFYAKNGKLKPQLIEKIKYLREKNPQMVGDLTNLIFNLLIGISQEGIDDQQLALCQKMKDLIIALTGYNPTLAQALENYLDYLRSLLPKKTPAPKIIPKNSTTFKAPVTNKQPETSPKQNTQEGEKPSTAGNLQPQPGNQEKTQGQNPESQIFPREDDKQNKKTPDGSKIVWSSELSRRFLNNILGHELLGITDKIPPGKYTITEIENIDFFGFPVELIHAMDQDGNEISFLLLINLAGEELKIGSDVSAYGYLERFFLEKSRK